MRDLLVELIEYDLAEQTKNLSSPDAEDRTSGFITGVEKFLSTQFDLDKNEIKYILTYPKKLFRESLLTLLSCSNLMSYLPKVLVHSTSGEADPIPLLISCIKKSIANTWLWERLYEDKTCNKMTLADFSELLDFIKEYRGF